MTAKSPFFVCGRCGFVNHPRLGQDNAKCEQCGEKNDHADAVDYTPTGAK